VAQGDGGEQCERHRREDMPGDTEGGDEHVLAGLQQRWREPVQPAVVRVPGGQRGEQHRLDRRQHQNARQVLQA